MPPGPAIPLVTTTSGLAWPDAPGWYKVTKPGPTASPPSTTPGSATKIVPGTGPVLPGPPEVAAATAGGVAMPVLATIPATRAAQVALPGRRERHPSRAGPESEKGLSEREGMVGSFAVTVPCREYSHSG